jgi:hypothetical protein
MIGQLPAVGQERSDERELDLPSQLNRRAEESGTALAGQEVVAVRTGSLMCRRKRGMREESG